MPQHYSRSKKPSGAKGIISLNFSQRRWQRISAAEEMAEIQASVSCHLLKNKTEVGVTILRESQWKELDKISKNANFRKIEKWKRKSRGQTTTRSWPDTFPFQILMNFIGHYNSHTILCWHISGLQIDSLISFIKHFHIW